MRDMDGPKKTYLMIPPVQPVIKEIFRQQQEEPVREDIGNGYPVMPIAEIKDQKIRGPEQEVDASVQQHQVNVGECILPGICFESILHMAAMPVVGQQHFQADDNSIQRGRDQQ